MYYGIEDMCTGDDMNNVELRHYQSIKKRRARTLTILILEDSCATPPAKFKSLYLLFNNWRRCGIFAYTSS